MGGRLLRRQFEIVHRMLDADAAAGLDAYARALLSEDLTVNCMLAGQKPLALSTWAGRIRLEPGSLGSYAEAVYASTDVYIGGLSEEDLDPVIGHGAAGLLIDLLITHARRARCAPLCSAGSIPRHREDSSASTFRT
jgi:hypothetical protein